MKIYRLLLSLAICGAGAIQVNAQTDRLGNGFNPPVVLTSQYDDLSFDEAEVAEDFLFEEPASPVINLPSVSNLEAPSPSDAIPAGKTVLEQRPIAPEPQSLPLVQPPKGQAVRVHASDVLAGITHVNSGPVMWASESQQNSPVARVLLRTDCNASQLWSGYPAERAAECAAMWNCLSKNCGTRCGCSHCVGPAVQQRGRVLNRYRSHSHSSCDSCDAGLAAAAPVGTVAKTVATTSPIVAPAQQPNAPVIRSLPSPPQTPPAQITSRPKFNTASTQYRAMR